MRAGTGAPNRRADTSLEMVGPADLRNVAQRREEARQAPLAVGLAEHHPVRTPYVTAGALPNDQ